MKLYNGNIENNEWRPDKSHVLRDGQCGFCGGRLYWNFDSDPDSPVYHAYCCEHFYNLTPWTYRVDVYAPE